MARLDQAGGGMALAGFTLHEIIKQQQKRKKLAEGKQTEVGTGLTVYPVVSVEREDSLLHFYCF